ncbi:alpha/beta fold hydrolase [Haliangium sp. UPWRP_2]|uniref:alpha/beta hydrolase family protein n=1 Tax=Haliangium sp. UPWRP_2 TaxID=1931276 RepID=UPI0013049747|nr:alpha/beta fold hydrolase [Haliangium sp. UPWRP_2]
MIHPATATEIRLTTEDGSVLGARIYAPAGPPRAVAVIHGGTAVPQTFYGRFAGYLAAAGIRVITYDYRGVGASRPRSLRGFSARMQDWAMDARAAMARAQEDGLPILWIGHSFGGQLLGLVEEAHTVAAAVLIGSQLGYAGHWPARLQPRIRLFWHLLVPVLTGALGYYPGRAFIGEDLPAGVAQQWRRWALHPSYYLSDQPQAQGHLARFDRPTLFYSFTDDDFAPERAVQTLLSRLSAAKILHRRLSPGELGVPAVGHFDAFRPRFEPTLWRETLGFLDHVLDGEPLPGALADALTLARDRPGRNQGSQQCEEYGQSSEKKDIPANKENTESKENEEIDRFLYLRDARWELSFSAGRRS